MPLFSSGDVRPSCILSCYSFLAAESVPFVLQFVQKAMRLLLHRVVNPHESIIELWKDIGPANLSEMGADVEIQKAFSGKKRLRSLSANKLYQMQENQRNASHQSVQTSTSLNLATKGMAPAPLLPTTIQKRSPNTQQFVFFGNEGHWAVQKAMQSWSSCASENIAYEGFDNNLGIASCQEQQKQPYLPQPKHLLCSLPSLPHSLRKHHYQEHYKLSHVNYEQNKANDVKEPHPTTKATDPNTIRANLIEFNAMAQMHTSSDSLPQFSPATASTAVVSNKTANPVHDRTYHAMQTQPQTVQFKNIIPHFQVEGCTEHLQNLVYCAPATTSQCIAIGVAPTAKSTLLGSEEKKVSRLNVVYVCTVQRTKWLILFLKNRSAVSKDAMGLPS